VTMNKAVFIVSISLGLSALGGATAEAGPLVIEPIELEAKIKKPEIPIFMNRENLNTDYRLVLKESFLPKIVESIEKKPF
jgi:hypothetical protein